MIWQFDSYKEALKDTLLNRKEDISRRFTFQEMAKACRVQKTYLSQVFRGDAQLNDDQVYLACGYLGLNDEQTRFVILLCQRERTVVEARRALIQNDIDSIREKYRRTEQHLKLKNPSVQLQNNEAAYFLDPNAQLVHAFLMVDRFASSPESICKELGLPLEIFSAIMLELQRLELITFEKGKIRILCDALHLPATSPIFRPHKAMLRMRSLERLSRVSPNSSYNFSAIFTADVKTRQEIQESFVEWLSSTGAKITKAPSRGVYQMAFDLFDWAADPHYLLRK